MQSNGHCQLAPFPLVARAWFMFSWVSAVAFNMTETNMKINSMLLLVQKDIVEDVAKARRLKI